MFLIPKNLSRWCGTLLLMLAMAGCTEKKSSTASVTPDYLHLTGTVFNGPGNGVEAVEISIMGLQTPIALTGADGGFAFTISDAQLIQAQKLAEQRFGTTSPGTFNLLFSFSGETKLMGISRPIAYASRGSQEIGDININLPASVTGKVTRLHGDGDFTPEAGVRVWIAGQETLTTEAGHFAFTNLPAGSLQAYMLRRDEPAVATELVLAPGEDLALTYPLVILPSDEVTGWLSPLPAPDPEGLVALSHPYRRSFKVHASPIAKFIRYHHDEDTFQDDTVEDWKPIRDKIHYDFPTAGTHKLYFQFIDENQEFRSDIRILTATTDIFYDTEGMIIGDGSGIITSRTVTLQIDVPSAATEMRFAESPEDFGSSLKWVKAAPVYEYVFSRSTNATTELTQMRELYVQFRRGGDESEESAIYRASALLEPFAGATHDIFTIGDGSDTFSNRVVDISIDLPENAWDMRLFTEGAVYNTLVGGVLIPNANRPELERHYIRAVENISFVFLTPGRKTLFLQLRTKEGLLSPIYKKDVFVLPFTAEALGFTIDGGAETSLSRTVTLEFQPPESAVGFRVSESETDLIGLPYQVLKNTHTMLLQNSGLRTVYVQYQDYDGVNSFVYSRTIFIDPFLTDPGSIALNGGAGLTQFPAVDIDILPPITAYEMRLSRASDTPEGPLCGLGGVGNNFFGPVTPSGDQGWQPVGTYAEALLEEPGAYVICAQFRTENGDEGVFIQQSIIYDPFPANIGDIVVNGNAAETNSRIVTLDIVVPPAAFSMRYGSSLSELLVTPFTDITTSIEYHLPYRFEEAEDRHRRVFVQFESVDGFRSAVFEDYILLNLFPTASLTAEINNGDATTSDTTLTITLTPPPEATGIQIAESLDDLNQAALLPSTTMTYTLEDTSDGLKTLYFRYISDGARQSAVFTDSIEKVP